MYKKIFCLFLMLFTLGCKNIQTDYNYNKKIEVRGTIASDVNVPIGKDSDTQLVFVVKDVEKIPISMSAHRALVQCFIYGKAVARITNESDTGTLGKGSIPLGRIYFLAEKAVCYSDSGKKVASDSIYGYAFDDDGNLGFRAVNGVIPDTFLAFGGQDIGLILKK